MTREDAATGLPVVDAVVEAPDGAFLEPLQP